MNNTMERTIFFLKISSYCLAGAKKGKIIFEHFELNDSKNSKKENPL